LPHPLLFPRSNFQTEVSGELTAAALNSWHHCGAHVTVPVVLGETPVQPCALARPAPARNKTKTATRYLQRLSNLQFVQIFIAPLIFRGISIPHRHTCRLTLLNMNKRRKSAKLSATCPVSSRAWPRLNLEKQLRVVHSHGTRSGGDAIYASAIIFGSSDENSEAQKRVVRRLVLA
jgi:hypothetical protein